MVRVGIQSLRFTSDSERTISQTNASGKSQRLKAVKIAIVNFQKRKN